MKDPLLLGLTPCILMDFPIYIDAISMGVTIVYGGQTYNFLNFDVVMLLKVAW